MQNELLITMMNGVQRKVSREDIFSFEKYLMDLPNAFLGDSEICPLKHSFCDGFYIRQMTIPAGVAISGAVHKHSHPSFLLKGELTIATEEGIQNLVAPLSMTSHTGVKRALYAKSETVLITVHPNPKNITDPSKLREMVVAETYAEYDQWMKEQKSFDKKEITNCGLVALRNISELKNISASTLIHLAQDNGITLTAYRATPQQIQEIRTPAIFQTPDHFIYLDTPLPELKYTGVVLSEKELPLEKITADELKNITGGTGAIVGGVIIAGIGAYGLISSSDANKDAAKANAAALQASASAQAEIARLEALRQQAAQNFSITQAKARQKRTIILIGVGVAALLTVVGFSIWIIRKK